MLCFHRQAPDEIQAEMRRALDRRIARAGFEHGGSSPIDTDQSDGAVRRQRSLQTCHRYSLNERPRHALPKEAGAYVPEMAAGIDDDPNLSDGTRRCACKLMEYAYRKNRDDRAPAITVTYLMKALRRCRRSVQRYLRSLEAEGYIRVDVVHGGRTRMCVGLIVHLLSPPSSRTTIEQNGPPAAETQRRHESHRIRDSIIHFGEIPMSSLASNERSSAWTGCFARL
jgi:hypothetical protein